MLPWSAAYVVASVMIPVSEWVPPRRLCVLTWSPGGWRESPWGSGGESPAWGGDHCRMAFRQWEERFWSPPWEVAWWLWRTSCVEKDLGGGRFLHDCARTLDERDNDDQRNCICCCKMWVLHALQDTIETVGVCNVNSCLSSFFSIKLKLDFNGQATASKIKLSIKKSSIDGNAILSLIMEHLELSNSFSRGDLGELLHVLWCWQVHEPDSRCPGT